MDGVEVFFVVDNSGSMSTKTSTGEIRRDIVINSMYMLMDDIYNNIPGVKVGLVRFASSGKNLQNGSTIMCNLTEEKNVIKKSIDNFIRINYEGGTNIESGLKKAQDAFSADCSNKIIILLTDGIPTDAVSNTGSTNVNNATKNRLKIIEESGISVISIMTGAKSSGNNIVSQIFGTEDNPTAGKFYNIEDTNIENVVKKDILKDIKYKSNSLINKVQIIDNFPDNVLENFDFSYVKEPSVGEVNKTVDMNNKSIIWNIDELKTGETAFLQYKLTLKQGTKLINESIELNKGVQFIYNDCDLKSHTYNLNDNLKIGIIKDVDDDKQEIENEEKVELKSEVIYNIDSNKTSVEVIIKSNKKVNKIDGWTLSEDGTTLSKVYYKNVNEVLKIKGEDNTEKSIEISVKDVVQDKTIIQGILPTTGSNALLAIGIVVFSIVLYFSYNFKEIHKKNKK